MAGEKMTLSASLVTWSLLSKQICTYISITKVRNIFLKYLIDLNVEILYVFCNSFSAVILVWWLMCWWWWRWWRWWWWWHSFGYPVLGRRVASGQPSRVPAPLPRRSLLAPLLHLDQEWAMSTDLCTANRVLESNRRIGSWLTVKTILQIISYSRR